MIKSISFWEKEFLLKQYDLIIIGGGFVGMSAAIHFKKLNPLKKVLILERGVISYGASTRNAGFSCFGSIGELEDDLKNSSISKIKDTVSMRFNGLMKLRSLVPDEQMDYQTTGSVELFDNKESFESANQRIDFWNEELIHLNGESIFSTKTMNEKGFYHFGIENPFEGQLNPKKAMESLVKKAKELGVEIYFGIEVLNWIDSNKIIEVNTKEGLNFQAKRIILATNAFTKSLIAELDVTPARNQVLITEEIEELSWNGCFHVEKGYIYFRNVGKRILLGGARNISENENVSEYGNTKEIATYLENYLKTKIIIDQKVKIDHWWSGILGIGQEKMPIIRKFAPRVYVAVRLGGMGVAIGTIVGEKIAQLVTTNEG